MKQQDNEMGGIVSYVSGAEEFAYLLGKALFNYGGYICEGLYNSGKEHKLGANTGIPNIDASELTPDGNFGKKYKGFALNSPPPWASKSKPARTADPTPTATAGGDATSPAEKLIPSVPTHTELRRKPSSQQAREAPSQTPGGWHNSNEPATKKLRTNHHTNSKQQVTSGMEEEQHEYHLRELISSMKVPLDGDEAGAVLDFSEIAGLQNVKVALEEFATFFLNFPHLTRHLRQRSTTGILLFGPQGTGKTMLIKSFAKRFGMTLYDIRASAIMSKFVGESEKFIRALFKEVRSNTPAVLMLDECDGLLCNPTADATQSHSYRLLQNEMKNQWSDLIHSRDEVIIIGITNKPHDIDMDGFGRRLSLKLHVELPSEKGCQLILKGALDRLRHTLTEEDYALLGGLCYERGLSGYDIDCLVEGQLRKSIREITISKHFKQMEWREQRITVPCQADDDGAMECSWNKVVASVEEVSYRPFEFGDMKAAILRARATVDDGMKDKHTMFASQYGTDD